jgi:probable phosphoglycerate mutase
MTTRLLLIRHAATVASAEDRFSGATDTPLSDEGRAQAIHLAQRLESCPPAAVYCSPMLRTRDTAVLLARPHHLTPQAVDGLREIDHGHWERLSRAEVKARYPGELAAWDDDPFGYAPPGGETGINVMARAVPAVREIVARHPGQTIYAVSHKATNRIIIGYYLGIEMRGFRERLDQQPACLNILDFRDPIHARLMLLNDVSHYEGEPDMAHVHLAKGWADQGA